MKFIKLVVVMNLLCATHGAIAQETLRKGYQYEIEISDCIQDAGDELAQRQQCYIAPTAWAESQQKAAYDLLMTSSMTDTKKKELQDVQRKWEQFREADCRFSGELPLSGPWPFVAREDCYLKHLVHRTNELTWLAILHLPPKEMQGKLPLRSK